MNENLQNQNSNQSQKHEFFAQQNKPKRDYDKEPLILRDYRGWAFGLNSFLLFLYWMYSLTYIFNELKNYEILLKYPDVIMQEIFIFVFVTITIFLVCSCLCLFAIKPKYTYFYNSKVVFYDQRYKIMDTMFFENYGDRIVLSNTYNEIGEKYEKYMEKEEGEFSYGSFLRGIAKTYYGRLFLSIFLLLAVLTPSNFIFDLFVIIFITLLTRFIEILVSMGIYKKSNKSLQNFWKYVGKFEIYIKWRSFDRWKPNAYIPMLFFNQKDHDDLREYVLAVFHRDIDENFKYISFQ